MRVRVHAAPPYYYFIQWNGLTHHVALNEPNSFLIVILMLMMTKMALYSAGVFAAFFFSISIFIFRTRYL